MALANLSTYYTWKNIKSAYINNNFETCDPTLNDEFYLPDGYLFQTYKTILNILLKNTRL